MALFYRCSALRLIDCVIKRGMKKFLIGCLILITACQSATQIPITVSVPTETPLPTFPSVTEPPTVDFTVTVPPTLEPPPIYFTDEFTSESPYWKFLQTGGVSAPSTTFEIGRAHV